MAASGRDQQRVRSMSSGLTSVGSATLASSGVTTVPRSDSGDGDTLGHADPAEVPMALAPGTRVSLAGGTFVLVQEIGRGSMGVVFEARHDPLGHRIAIKALHPHIAQNPNVIWRFKREAQITASLKHPNIVSVFDVGKERDSIYFLVEELLDGVSFRRLLQQRGRLEIRETLDHLVPIMGALVAAHERGIVHRDVKPENIFLAQTAARAVVPKLIDFGLAKVASEKGEFETQIGVVLGTPSYMSPEQALGSKVDARTDVWSLGVILFEALSGERPFHAEKGATIVERMMPSDGRSLARLSPHVPAELVGIVHRALERDLSRRFPSMLEFLTAVVCFAEKRDPGFASRHALSIPRSLIADPDAFASEDVDPPSLRRRSVSQSKFRAIRPPVDSNAGESMAPPGGSAVALAEQALAANDLARAVELAEQAISEQPSSATIKGRMRLVQAVACQWLGRLVEAERYAQVACRHLPKGSARWFAAVSNLIAVLAGKGEGEFLGDPADDLMHAQPNRNQAAQGAQVRALGQSAIALIRADQRELADRSFEMAEALAETLPYDEVDVRVWLDLAEAEVALHDGDHVRFLNLTELALETFAGRGDIRNACLCRAGVGVGYLRLGAFVRAERELRAALAMSEPLELGCVAVVRMNMGVALAKLGLVREARSAVSDALRRCVEQGHGRFVPVCHLHLAEIARLMGDLPGAQRHAEQAVAASSNLPSVHASALSTLADVLVRGGQPAEALEQSTRAMAILGALESVDDGESLIRLAHVHALAARGRGLEARACLDLAHLRLEQRALRISDPRWRRTFMEEIPENRETHQLFIGER
jgi:eukaryotic-like serine/threonine-protein kinase